MTTIDSLSNELLLQLFQYLDFINHERDVYSCMLVSRRWYDLALPIVWGTLHFDFDWKTSYYIRKEGIKPTIRWHLPGHAMDFTRRIPLHLDQFRSSLERQEKKSVLHPLEWCRFLTLEVDTATLDFGATSTAEIVFILLRCNRIRNADIYLRLRDENTLPAFQFIWGLISRYLSK